MSLAYASRGLTGSGACYASRGLVCLEEVAVSVAAEQAWIAQAQTTYNSKVVTTVLATQAQFSSNLQAKAETESKTKTSAVSSTRLSRSLGGTKL